MKTPFLHLVRRLAQATPASWFPACLEEASGYVPRLLDQGGAARPFTLAPRAERLRTRQLASAGALFAAPGYPPFGAVLVLPASTGESPLTVADDLRRRLAGDARALLDAALADPRLVAHIDLGAAAGSIAGMAGLQFLRDRHAIAVGHYWLADAWQEQDTRFDATSVCVQVAGVPANLALWLAAGIASVAGAPRVLVLGEDEDGAWSLTQNRAPGVRVH